MLNGKVSTNAMDTYKLGLASVTVILIAAGTANFWRECVDYVTIVT